MCAAVGIIGVWEVFVKSLSSWECVRESCVVIDFEKLEKDVER